MRLNVVYCSCRVQIIYGHFVALCHTPVVLATLVMRYPCLHLMVPSSLMLQVVVF